MGVGEVTKGSLSITYHLNYFTSERGLVSTTPPYLPTNIVTRVGEGVSGCNE